MQFAPACTPRVYYNLDHNHVQQSTAPNIVKNNRPLPLAKVSKAERLCSFSRQIQLTADDHGLDQDLHTTLGLVATPDETDSKDNYNVWKFEFTGEVYIVCTR
jgi:hypothetical protein